MYRDAEPAELAARLGTSDQPFVLDVREPVEFAAWSIPSAVNIPLGELEARVSEVPTDREVVTVCASGSRSSIGGGDTQPRRETGGQSCRRHGRVGHGLRRRHGRA